MLRLRRVALIRKKKKYAALLCGSEHGIKQDGKHAEQRKQRSASVS